LIELEKLEKRRHGSLCWRGFPATQVDVQEQVTFPLNQDQPEISGYQAVRLQTAVLRSVGLHGLRHVHHSPTAAE